MSGADVGVLVGVESEQDRRDRHGKSQTLVSNQVGNFFLEEGALELEFPLWVKLEYQGEVTAMQTPIFRERSCAACHMDPANSKRAGRVYLWEDP